MKQITVFHKDEEFKLPSGHSVYECNLNTGEVSLAELYIPKITVLQKINDLVLKSNGAKTANRKVYHIKEKPDCVYVPAYDIHKAETKLKFIKKLLSKKQTHNAKQ